MPFYYGDIDIAENDPLPFNICLATGTKIKYKNPPVPPGPVNPEVINISLDFENNLYSPDNDFYISKDQKFKLIRIYYQI